MTNRSFGIKTKSHGSVAVVITYEAGQEINQTSFRGLEVQQASNFSNWNSVEDMVGDQAVQSLIAQALDERLEEGLVHFEIEIGESVGWADVLHLNEVTPAMCGVRPQPLEFDAAGNPKRKRKDTFEEPVKSVKRLSITDPDVTAPQTTLACFIGEAKQEGGSWTYALSMVRPGPDIGPRSGRVTERYNIAFIPPENPGDVSDSAWDRMITTME